MRHLGRLLFIFPLLVLSTYSNAESTTVTRATTARSAASNASHSAAVSTNPAATGLASKAIPQPAPSISTKSAPSTASIGPTSSNRPTWGDIFNASFQVALSAFVSALVTGLFLIGAYFISRKIDKEKSEQAIWRKIGVTYLNAADDFVARQFDIFGRGHPINLSAPIVYSGFPPHNPPRELSTVWRLMVIFGSSHMLEHALTDADPRSRLSILDFYTHKYQLGAKGNLTKARYRLQTEAQQLIGARLVAVMEKNKKGFSKDSHPIDFYKFLESLASDSEIQLVTDSTRQFLDYNSDINKACPQRLTIVLTLIYFIDMVQDIRNVGKWEEFRVFLVSLLRAHNHSTNGNAMFLYKKGDLESTSYFNTYNIMPKDHRFLRYKFLKPLTVVRRWFRIRARSRAEPNAYDRKISSTGVRRVIRNEAINLDWNSTPGDLLVELKKIVAPQS